MDFQLTLSYKEYSVYQSILSIFCSFFRRTTEFGGGKIVGLSLEAQAVLFPKTNTLMSPSLSQHWCPYL